MDAKQQTPLVKEQEKQNTDTTIKQRPKDLVERKQHAKPIPLVPGEKAVVKQRRKNKTILYEPKHYTITAVRESQIVATKSNGKVITQLKAYLKWLGLAEKCDKHLTPTSRSDIELTSDNKVKRDNMFHSSDNE